MSAEINDPRFAQSYLNYCDYIDSLMPKPQAIFRSMEPADFGGDASNMADRTHLNEAGAQLYSTQLGEKIRSFMRHAPKSRTGKNPAK